MNISSNISSIQAQQTAMNTNANNIANVNSDRFLPKDTIITDSAGTPTPNTRAADDNGSQRSQTDLAKEIPDQIEIESAVAVNVTAIKTQDELLGSLLDIKA